MKLVEFAEAEADLLEQGESQSGRAFDECKHFVARQEIDFRILHRRGRCGTGAIFDDGHFAENFPRAEPRKDVAPAFAGGNFHDAVFDEIDAIAGLTFQEDFLPAVETSFPGDDPQRLKFGRFQMAEKREGFQHAHPFTLIGFASLGASNALNEFLHRNSCATNAFLLGEPYRQETMPGSNYGADAIAA